MRCGGGPTASEWPRPAGDPGRAFEASAVPGAEIGGSPIGALKKRHQGGFGIPRLSYRVVRKQEFADAGDTGISAKPGGAR